MVIKIVSKELLVERRKKVMELMLQGATEAEMAKGLNVSMRSITTDKKNIRKTLWNNLKNNPKEYILEKYFMQNEKIIKEAWSLYRHGAEPTKTKALAIINKSTEKFIDSMIKMGLIVKPEEKIELRTNALEVLSGLFDDDRSEKSESQETGNEDIQE